MRWAFGEKKGWIIWILLTVRADGTSMKAWADAKSERRRKKDTRFMFSVLFSFRSVIILWESILLGLDTGTRTDEGKLWIYHSKPTSLRITLRIKVPTGPCLKDFIRDGRRIWQPVLWDPPEECENPNPSVIVRTRTWNNALSRILFGTKVE